MIAKILTHITLLILLMVGLSKIANYVLYLCNVPKYDTVLELYNKSIMAWVVTICFVIIYVKGTNYIKKFINFIQDK